VIVNKSALWTKIAKLACRVTSLLNIKFASVDIVEINNELLILEINSGVMLEKFSSFSKENYKIAKKIYEKVITSM
jgi:glutathione synthase/RimK-type ligase-like ATP-grasp enzyme